MENELYHHGILGMKWGVRRFQNANGSLTEAGKKRYSETVDKALKPGKDGKPSLAEKATRNVKNAVDIADSMVTSNEKNRAVARKEARELSDEELRKRINRLRMEKQYAELAASNELSDGKARVHEILKTTGEVMGIATAAATAAAAIYQIKKG